MALGVVGSSSGCGGGCGQVTLGDAEITPPPPPTPLEGCVGLADGVDGAEEGSKGVKLQCRGTGEPKLEWRLACNLPPECYQADGDFRWGFTLCAEAAEVCPPASEVQAGNVQALAQLAELFEFSFGSEPYDVASVTACCADETPLPDAQTREASCEASCAKMSCENVHAYIEYLRSDDERLAEICCLFDTEDCPGQFDCLAGGGEDQQCGIHGPLFDVCKQATEQWLADTAHDAWSQNCIANSGDQDFDCQIKAENPTASCAGRCGEADVGGCSCAPDCAESQNCCDDVCTYCAATTDACFLGDCALRQAAGEPVRLSPVDVNDLEWTRGVPLGSYQFDVMLREVAFDSVCEMADPPAGPTLAPPEPPEACGELSYGGPPNGWPEGAGWAEAIVPMNPDAGPSQSTALGYVADPEAASAVESELNLPSEVQSFVQQGQLAYGTPFCDGVGCTFVLNNVDLVMAGVVQEFQKQGTRRVVVENSRMWLNGRALGEVTAVDQDGTVHFVLPAGALRAHLKGKAAHQKKEAGSWKTVASWDDELPVATVADTHGRILPDGRLVIDDLRLEAADFGLLLSLESDPPLETAPEVEIVHEALPCGGERLVANATDAQDDPQDLTYTWTRDGIVIGTGPVLELPYQPIDLYGPVQTIFLRVTDTAGLSRDRATVAKITPPAGPTIAFPDGGQQVELRTCVPDFAEYVLPVPEVDDACAGADQVTLTALLTSVNGIAPPFPVVPVDPQGAFVSLPPGTHQITWRAFSPYGTTEVVQDVHVALVQPQPGDFGDITGVTHECCAPGQTLVLGTSGADQKSGQGATDYCVMTFAGADDLSFSAGNDSIFSGPGDDVVVSGTGRDLVYGSGGDDALFASSDFPLGLPGPGSDAVHNRLYGGFGADLLQGGVRADWLSGGRGPDTLLGGPGDDRIYPGRGRDLVDAGAGDDEIYIYDACELSPAPEIIVCGPGQDTVFAPVAPIEFSFPFQIRVNYLPIGCENVIVTQQLAFRSECHYAAIGGPGDIGGNDGNP